jgi:hypothetical protein
VLGLRKLGYVIAGILKGEEIATARQRYWIIKGPFPATLSRWRASLAASAHPRSKRRYFSSQPPCAERRVFATKICSCPFGHADGLRCWLGRGPTQMVVLETHLRRAASLRLEMLNWWNERQVRNAKWPFGVIGNPQINFKQISTPVRYHPRII